MSRILCGLAGVVALVSFTACSGDSAGGSGSSPSSDAFVKQKLDKVMKEKSDGRISLASFEKTNSQEGEQSGVSFHEVRFSGEISFTSDCYWVNESGPWDENYFCTEPSTVVYQNLRSWFHGEQGDCLLGLAGDTATIQGSVLFQKTENGWLVKRITYSAPDGQSYAEAAKKRLMESPDAETAAKLKRELNDRAAQLISLLEAGRYREYLEICVIPERADDVDIDSIMAADNFEKRMERQLENLKRAQREKYDPTFVKDGNVATVTYIRDMLGDHRLVFVRRDDQWRLGMDL